MKKVLILIPTHNAQKYLSTTLESIKNQEYDHSEIKINTAIVDNASDGMLEMSLMFNSFDCDFYLHNENVGRIGNWNRCLAIFEESDADYLKIIFAGDTIEPDCIRKQLETNSDMVTCSHTVLKEDGSSYGMKHYEYNITLQPRTALNDSLHRGNWFAGTTSCVLFSKRALKGKRFSGQLDWAADWEFWAEMASENDVTYLVEPLATFNMSARQGYKRMAGTPKAAKEEEIVLNYIKNILLPITK